MGQHSPHAVTDKNIRKVIRISLVHSGQFLTQSKRGVENGIAGRIRKQPWLVTFSNLRVLLKAVDCLNPRKRSRGKTMDKHDWNSVGIVRFKKIQPCFVHHVGATQGAHHSKEQQVVWWLEIGDRSGKVGCERARLALYRCKRLIAWSSQRKDSI